MSGVFVMSAGDPSYREVLKASPVRSKWGHSHPISMAEIGSWGESSVMIVFDSPVSVRTQKISNDPTQLIRNVALIIDKALQAVAKYATMGV